MNVEKIVSLVGLLLVVVVGVGVSIPQADLGIVLFGAVSGYFVSSSDRKALLVTAIAIAAVSGGLGAIPTVGMYITGIVSQLGNLVNASAVVAILLTVYEKASAK
jgi:hypothetical protein